jgi:hypothetical protein
MKAIKIGNYYVVFYKGKKHFAKTEKRALQKALTSK